MKAITLITILLLIFTSCSKFKSTSSRERQEVDSLLDLAQEHSASIDMENSLKCAFEALDLAQSSNFRKGIAESYFYISQALFDTGNYDKSMEYVILGEEYTDGNPQLTSEFIRIKARIYSYLELHEESKKEFLKGLTYTKQINNQLRRDYFTALGYENLSHLFTVLECPDSALLYTQKEIQILSSMDEPQVHTILINAYTSLGKFQVLENKLDSAQYFFDKSIEIAHKYDYPYFYRTYSYKGDMYLTINNADSALHYYYKALENAEELGLRGAYLSLYEKLSNIYLSINDTVTAHGYDKKKNAIEKELNDNLLNSAKKILNILISKEDQLKSEQKKKYYIFSAIIILSIIISIWISKRYIKNKIIRKKEKEIEELKVKVNGSFTEVIELAKKNDSAFMAKFHEVYPEFSNTLKEHYPKLLFSELHILALIYLRFSTKEIADFTSRSCRTIENRKYRLRKKLNIGTDIDVYFWLNKFFQSLTKEKRI